MPDPSERAAATGSRRLVTACPGCFIHLRCAQEGLGKEASAEDTAVEIIDLWNLLADAIPSAPTARKARDGRKTAAAQTSQSG